MNKIKNWVTPLIISILIFVVVRPVFAQIIEGQSGSVEVGIEVSDGHSQVYYIFNGQKTFVNRNSQNKRQPSSNGEYLVWVGDVNEAGQIYLYHILTDTMTQLTSLSTNQKPKISKEGKVVWEGWVGDTWQIFFFDGKSVRQLTNGEASVNPDIEGDNIVFGQKDGASWRAQVYSISKNEFKDITVGIEAQYPKLTNGKIKLGVIGSEKDFPLTVDDLFLLNLVPLAATASASPSATPVLNAPETVTIEEITQELNASPSASTTETPIPESSSSGQLEASPTPGI